MLRPAPRLQYIDTLRGIACLWVVVCHVNDTWSHEVKATALTQDAAIGLVSQAGWMGVYLFLALSGFCLYYPLVRKNNFKIDLAEFARRRCRRILPPYYAAMVMVFILKLLPIENFGRMPSKFDWITHALMIHNLHPRFVLSINSDFWSLALEFQLYVLFPLLVLAMVRWGTTRVLIGAVLLSGLYQLAIYFVAGSALQNAGFLDRVLYRSVIGGLSCFVCGMAAARLVALSIPNQTRWATIVALLTLPFNIWAFFQVGTIVPVHHVTLGILFSCLIVIIAGLEMRKVQEDFVESTWQRVTRPGWAFMAWVGGFSYSMYLIHHPLLKVARPWVEDLGLSRAGNLGLFFVVGLPLITALSYAFFFAFERPFIGAKRRKDLQPVETAEGQTVAVARATN